MPLLDETELRLSSRRILAASHSAAKLDSEPKKEPRPPANGRQQPRLMESFKFSLSSRAVNFFGGGAGLRRQYSLVRPGRASSARA
jgi:hypothetical protein